MRQLQSIPREWLNEAHLTSVQQDELVQRDTRWLNELAEDFAAKIGDEEPDFDTWEAEK